MEHRTAAGAIAGAVVAGPVGVVAGAGAGAVVDKVSK
jgi:outer membrane lipoprotein SlyB